MKLLVKFNLIYILVMAIGVGVSSYITRNLLVRNAQDEVLNNARLLVEKANAVRGYTSGQIAKLLSEYDTLPKAPFSTHPLETHNLLLAAQVVVDQAIARKENVGLHFNEDNPTSPAQSNGAREPLPDTLPTALRF